MGVCSSLICFALSTVYIDDVNADCKSCEWRDNCPPTAEMYGCSDENKCRDENECPEDCQYCIADDSKDCSGESLSCVKCKQGFVMTDNGCSSCDASAKCAWNFDAIFLSDSSSFEIVRKCECLGDKLSRFAMSLAVQEFPQSHLNTYAWELECAKTLYANITGFTDNSPDPLLDLCDIEVYPGILNGSDIFAISNALVVNRLASSRASQFEWQHHLFLNEGELRFDDYNSSIAVQRGSMKFALNFLNWPDAHTFPVCFDIDATEHYEDRESLTSKQIRAALMAVSEEDLSFIRLGRYEFFNAGKAHCEGHEDVDVVISSTEPAFVENNGTFTVSLRLCYQFGECESNSISYDPFVYYEEDAACMYNCNMNVLCVLVMLFLTVWRCG